MGKRTWFKTVAFRNRKPSSAAKELTKNIKNVVLFLRKFKQNKAKRAKLFTKRLREAREAREQ